VACADGSCKNGVCCNAPTCDLMGTTDQCM
jgi:hypothetical protein